jgi:hypothetical protein
MATTTVTTFNQQGQQTAQNTVTVSDEQVNADTLQTRARTALAANATFLALASPTNAQVTAQVQRLTRECTALIRLIVNELSTTDGS